MKENLKEVFELENQPLKGLTNEENLTNLSIEEGSQNPLFLKGWIEFNKVKWNVKPVETRFELENNSLPKMDVILYQDERGRIIRPPLNPYLTIKFHSTNTTHSYRYTSQWLQLANLLIKEFSSFRLNGPLFLPPEINDIRPWQWEGYQTNVRYTYHVTFPYDLQSANPRIRSLIKKATKLGYRCLKTTNVYDIWECLESTENRKKFQHQLKPEDIELARSFLGDDQLRGYICYSPEGKPASGSFVLYAPSGPAIGWLLGSKAEHLRNGTSPMLYAYILEDLQKIGATGLDLHGANIPSVASAKSSWGFDLTPYYVIEQPGLKSAIDYIKEWWKFRSKG